MSIAERLIAFAEVNDEEVWKFGDYYEYDIYKLNYTATFIISTDQFVQCDGRRNIDMINHWDDTINEGMNVYLVLRYRLEETDRNLSKGSCHYVLDLRDSIHINILYFNATNVDLTFTSYSDHNNQQCEIIRVR